jgi:hypothetical protein
VRADGVEVTPPSLDHHLGFGQAEEHLAVEQFVSQLAVEALAVAILPRAAGLDVGGEPLRGITFLIRQDFGSGRRR